MEPRRRSDPGFGSGPPRYPGTFLLAFREALAEMHWQAKRWMGDAVECVDENGSTRVVGLENLYRRVRGSERGEWPVVITEFLRTALGAEADVNLPTDLNAVAAQVLVRLGPPMAPETMGVALWTQPLDETGLVVNLVIDFPERMIYVTQQMVEESRRSGDEWLKTALANLRERSGPTAFQVIDEPSGLLSCRVDAYNSSRALLLDVLLPQGKTLGWFVALPSRDELLVLPVSRPALAFIFGLKRAAEHEYQRAPYAISPEIFWIHDGHWRPFRIDVDGTRVLLQPPDEFVEILEELMPADGQESEPDAPKGPTEG